MKKKKDKKKTDVIKSYIFFIIVTSLTFIGGFTKTIITKENINEYENRTAYNYEKPTIKTIVNKEFQDNIELTLSDQIPLSTMMKKSYNRVNTLANATIMRNITKEYCKDHYVSILPGLITYGCDNNIVYEQRMLDKESLDSRISNLNQAVENTNAKTYVFYIEKDTDINFETNKQSDIDKYIKENINTERFFVYETNNFEDFKNNFYKTDHHWNLDGSYKGYLDLAKLLNVKNTLEHGEVQCKTNSFSGSKSGAGAALSIYNEDMCIYKFDLPKHTIKINGKEADYYSATDISQLESISYATAYGDDYAEIIFDYNQKKKDNILLIGESYDNAILELIASHYNKTYSIDLRHYERTFGEKFNYTKYIKDNDIDKVIFIGNIDFFVSDVFNVEVE